MAEEDPSLKPGAVHAVRDLVAARPGSEYRRVRERLAQIPPPLRVPALLEALQNAADFRAFDRAATALAAAGGDAAFEALSLQARTQRRYPRTAVRALSKCADARTVPALIDLMHYGRKAQAGAAALALGRLKSGMAVEALCRHAQKGAAGTGPEARTALHNIGSPQAIGRVVLAESRLDTRGRVQAVLALEVVYGLLRRFNAQRFLDREAGRWLSPTREQARQAAELLRAESQLLRPFEGCDSEILLRPAHGPGSDGAEMLLRASDEDSGSEQAEEPAPRGFGRWLGILKRQPGPR